MTQEPMQIVVDGLTLRGNLYKPAGEAKKLAVLFIHGWTGRPNDDAASLLAKNDIATITFSFRGHNNSDGKLEDVTRENSLKDTVSVYDCFKQKLPISTKIVLAGSSYGSYIASLLSTKRNVAGLSLRVPANYPDERFTDPQLSQAPDQSNTFLTEWRKKIIDHNATMSMRAVNNFDGPIQIIEAADDEIVPTQTVQNYVNAVKNKSKLDYHLMKGWPHSLGEDPERNRQYQELLLNWLNKQL